MYVYTYIKQEREILFSYSNPFLLTEVSLQGGHFGGDTCIEAEKTTAHILVVVFQHREFTLKFKEIYLF